MSEPKHTPEPWVGDKPSEWDIEHYLPEYGTYPAGITGADQTRVLDCHSLEDGAWAKPEDIRRIVACVNACEGLSTEALEQGALNNLLEYVEANRRYIPLHMGSKNTGAATAARDALASDAGRALLERLEKAEAECAAMREALGKVQNFLGDQYWTETVAAKRAADVGDVVFHALAVTPEKLTRDDQRAIAEARKEFVDGKGLTTEQAKRQLDLASDAGCCKTAIHETVERCAKLFEGPGSHLSSWHAPDVAARIRRLGEGT